MTDGTLERRIEAIAAVLTLSGRLNQVPDNPTALFSDAGIVQAANNTQTLIDLVRADNPELADRLAGSQRAVTATPVELAPSTIQAAPDIGNLQVQGAVSFGVGSAQLTAQGQQTLNQLAQEIQEFNVQTVAVRVIGHTSRTGDAAFNQQLSQQRAQVVVNYLRQRGVQHNIIAEGQGYNQPLPNIPPEDARNQRMEIRLVRVDATNTSSRLPNEFMLAQAIAPFITPQTTDW
jgi:outer membrane protein OmpA-like peptidoglycan-associated protein